MFLNSRQLHYAVLLSQIRNFSQVADMLHITQPALSKQILSLESELDLKLFDRTTNPISLTPAGEYFVQQAQDILYQEDQLIRSLERYKSGEKGRLTIGISPFRSLYLGPKLVKAIKKRFPGVQICLHETNSTQIRKEIAEGKYDFAIANLPVDESVLDVMPLNPDTLVLAVPSKMLPLLAELTDDSDLAEISFSSCRDLPFIVVSPAQEMRQLFDKLCAKAGFHPSIAMEVNGVTTAWAMAAAGIGATLLPLQFAREETFAKEDIALFRLEDELFQRQPAIITRRGQYISEYAAYAIQFLTNESSRS